MRDTVRLRSYRGLKLASWLIEGSFWEDTLSPNQVMFMINRVLNNVEVYGRWDLTEIDVDFSGRGTTAWAMSTQKGKGQIHLPAGTRSALIVLHEVAHLLPTSKREAHHGPGFNAIHLMLVDLFLSKEKSRVLAAAYHATATPIDPLKIPQSSYNSKYLPIVGVNLEDTIGYIGVLVNSGVLNQEDVVVAKRMLTKLKRELTKEPSLPLKELPDKIVIPTRALLRAMTHEEIAQVVINELRKELLPGRMTHPKIDPKEKARSSRLETQRKRISEQNQKFTARKSQQVKDSD